MRKQFVTYFKEDYRSFAWVRDLFVSTANELSIDMQEQLIELKSDSRLKELFSSCPLLSFWGPNCNEPALGGPSLQKVENPCLSGRKRPQQHKRVKPCLYFCLSLHHKPLLTVCTPPQKDMAFILVAFHYSFKQQGATRSNCPLKPLGISGKKSSAFGFILHQIINLDRIYHYLLKVVFKQLVLNAI